MNIVSAKDIIDISSLNKSIIVDFFNNVYIPFLDKVKEGEFFDMKEVHKSWDKFVEDVKKKYGNIDMLFLNSIDGQMGVMSFLEDSWLRPETSVDAFKTYFRIVDVLNSSTVLKSVEHENVASYATYDISTMIEKHQVDKEVYGISVFSDTFIPLFILSELSRITAAMMGKPFGEKVDENDITGGYIFNPLNIPTELIDFCDTFGNQVVSVIQSNGFGAEYAISPIFYRSNIFGDWFVMDTTGFLNLDLSYVVTSDEKIIEAFHERSDALSMKRSSVSDIKDFYRSINDISGSTTFCADIRVEPLFAPFPCVDNRADKRIILEYNDKIYNEILNNVMTLITNTVNTNLHGYILKEFVKAGYKAGAGSIYIPIEKDPSEDTETV